MLHAPKITDMLELMQFAWICWAPFQITIYHRPGTVSMFLSHITKYRAVARMSCVVVPMITQPALFTIAFLRPIRAVNASNHSMPTTTSAARFLIRRARLQAVLCECPASCGPQTYMGGHAMLLRGSLFYAAEFCAARPLTTASLCSTRREHLKHSSS